MIGTIRKHQTWLWAVIIVAVVISFVIYFTPTVSQSRGGGYTGQYGAIHGQPITQRQYYDAITEAQIGQYLRSRNWPEWNDSNRLQFDRIARERILVADRLKALGVVVTDASVAAWIEDNLGNPGQPGSARLDYENLVTDLKQRKIGENQIVQFIRHEIGISHLLALAGVAGELVTPREAERDYRERSEQLEVEAVVFSSSNFLASVALDPERIAQFYTNRLANYRIPEKVQVQYVRFDASNHITQAEAVLAKRTNLTAEIDAYYLRAGANRFMDTNGQVMTPDAAKGRIRSEMIEAESRTAARRAAAAFGTELEKLQPVKAENLATLATEKGLALHTTAPFSELEGPRELNVRQTFTRAAFALSPERPISPPVAGEDAFYLLAFKGRIPSEVPGLDAVRDRVTEEFKTDQARLLARQAGTNFVSSLTNLLAQGKTFGDACQAAELTSMALPPFTPAAESPAGWDRRINFAQARNVALGLKPGEASPFQVTADGGFVLSLKRREPATDQAVKEGLTAHLAEMRERRRFEGFSDWFQYQIQETGLTMPTEEGDGR